MKRDRRQRPSRPKRTRKICAIAECGERAQRSMPSCEKHQPLFPFGGDKKSSVNIAAAEYREPEIEPHAEGGQ